MDNGKENGNYYIVSGTKKINVARTTESVLAAAAAAASSSATPVAVLVAVAAVAVVHAKSNFHHQPPSVQAPKTARPEKHDSKEPS